MVLKILFALVILANAGDNVTTYLALTMPTDAVILEANPIAAWLFETMGLAEGLIFEFVLSVGLLYWLMGLERFSYRTKVVIFVVILLPSVWAVANNVGVLTSGVFV